MPISLTHVTCVIVYFLPPLVVAAGYRLRLTVWQCRSFRQVLHARLGQEWHQCQTVWLVVTSRLSVCWDCDGRDSVSSYLLVCWLRVARFLSDFSKAGVDDCPGSCLLCAAVCRSSNVGYYGREGDISLKFPGLCHSFTECHTADIAIS